MKVFERVKLIISETLGSPSIDSYVATVGDETIVLKEYGNYKGIDLSNLDLEGAHLEGVNLQDANLQNTNLAGAYLDGANLTGANLTDTILAGAHLAKVTIEEDAFKLAHFDVKPIGIDINFETLKEKKS